MNRQELVRKVAQKLQINEDVVDAIYMHQTKAVSESLKHPDRNMIFFPKLGTLSFKVSKGADRLWNYLRRIVRYKKKIETTTNIRSVNSMKERIKQMDELSTVLKWKVSFVTDKYNGIRMDAINKSLDFYSGGKFKKFVNELRLERENGFYPEN